MTCAAAVAGEAVDAMQKRSSESRKIALSGVFGLLAAVR